MIECHPLLRPIVNLAKPVVHAAKTWHPKVVGVRHHVRHHVHRAINAATPSQTVLTVCQRVAGPLLAGGLVLLPPASAPPPAGGVGGFPGAIVPEYGAPAFAPGYATGGNPFAYAPGTGYGPGALGLGGGILAPTVLASNFPQATSPGTTTPSPVTITENTPPTTPVTPVLPGTTQPGTTTPPPDTNTPPVVTPPTTTPPTIAPPATTPPITTQPGDTTPPPTNTPEPASIAVLAGAFALAIFSRALWTRRTRRD